MNLWISVFSRVFLLACLVFSGHIRADEDFIEIFTGKPLSALAQDRAFEGAIYLMLEQQIGPAAQYVQFTRFGNTLVISGEVEKASQARAIDELVLKAAGIKRESAAGSEVVPERGQACDGKPVLGNAKRQMIVKSNRDCSSLRRDEPGQVRGQVYNHIAVAAKEPAIKVAESGQLVARAVLELVDAGHAEVLDRAVMRLVAQDDVLYVLGRAADIERSRIQEILTALPGVLDVEFYLE